MRDIVFVTHNQGKIDSAQKYLTNAHLEIFKYEVDEPRSDDIRVISEYKVRQAYELVKKPCISLDAGFFIDHLNGFPRAYVNHALDTIGIAGILKLMEGVDNRECKFLEYLSYYDGTDLLQFKGIHPGTLAKEIRGADRNKKWSDLWYIFVPRGCEKTLSEMTDEERETRPRIDSQEAMIEFAKFLNEEQEDRL